MRFSLKKLCALIVASGLCAVLGAAGASAAEEAKPSGWYVGLGLGSNKTSTLKQAGHNRDNICYPEDDCSHLAGGAPEGYRWYYDLEADDGAVFEISVGRTFGAFRLELALAQRKNDLEQKFTDITYLDGSRSMRAQDSNYVSRSSGGVDELTTRTLSMNAYYDFSIAGSRFTPYVGAGVGVSFLELSGLYFESWYSCKNPAMDCDMPERYNSRQYEDISDTVLSTHLHAGLDYRMSERMQFGLKLTYSMVGDMEDAEGGYDFHPVAGLSNFTTISGMNHWSVMFGVKYFFGE
ncbi:MAG: outer membrane beta-barrel protein [Nitrospinae bacterium]|nr:outer membrane beta-barrel protein [Nitrospinota bacterium]